MYDLTSYQVLRNPLHIRYLQQNSVSRYSLFPEPSFPQEQHELFQHRKVQRNQNVQTQALYTSYQDSIM